ncbi:MAG: 3-oxo-5-alpha-steroid 4-dehydrogenase [Bacteroidota bacterium]|nr:3-oxo-5-alpha-steroid 4-dehydrogenase [Bacteroidota bacterium]
MISNQLGWVIMEGWAPVVFLSVYIYFFRFNSYAVFFAVLYLLHYIHRSFIFPLRTNTKGKQMPVMIMLSAMMFNSVNAGINGYYLSNFADYPVHYFLHWNFILGVILFFAGFAINFYADDILIHLRKPGEKDYKIPKGFLFEYISCPNHFGEMIEWLGYFLMCWNLASFAFFVWTVSNLLPRALHHHKWYLENFKDYPKERKAVFPFIW